MTNERSDRIHESWRQASEKFDYFVLGVTGALCAYVSQTYQPIKLGINAGTLELLALVVLVCSAVAGFKRIEKTVLITRLNHQFLRAKEELGSLVKTGGAPVLNETTGDILTPAMIHSEIERKSNMLPPLAKQMDVLVKKVQLTYRVRNWLLVGGFVLLLASKVWGAYEQP